MRGSHRRGATTGSRLFDAGVEEPELLEADRRARAVKQGARQRGQPRTGPAAAVGDRRREAASVDGTRSGRAGAKGRHRRGTTGDDRSGPVMPQKRTRHGAATGRRTARSAGGPAIDPRIAARRADVAAEEAAAGYRRRRRLAITTLAVVAVVAAGGLALLSPLASVRTIEVRGAARTGAPGVRAASGLGSDPPLVRVSTSKVAARIAALPWVLQARVERRWPRTVVVSVVERHPAAIAPCQAGGADSCLVDADGRVLAAVTDDPAAAVALPRLLGVLAAGAPGATIPETARGALAVAVAIPDALRSLVLGVRTEGGEVALDLRAPGRTANPPVVRLGVPDHIADKLTAAATVLARTSVNAVGVLDVRVPASPALTRIRR